MKKLEFIKLIKEAIIPEVRKVVREELEMLNKEKVDHSKIMNHGIRMSELSDSNRIKKPIKRKMFTKNSGLNDILNETARDMSDSEEYKTMGKKTLYW